MLKPTLGIVLRSVKFGETSLVTTIFTQEFGVQSYMVKGVRSAKSKNQKAALLQPTTLLDLLVYNSPNKKLQFIKEFSCFFPYQQQQEQIVKNSIALFSVEFLLKLLPENAPLQELFEFCLSYFQAIDSMNLNEIANFPLYFIAQCSKILGYELKGNFKESTPYLNIIDGGFSAIPPLMPPFIVEESAQKLSNLLSCANLVTLKDIGMSATTRFELLEWYLTFLHHYAQHLGTIKSLSVLRTILH